MAINYIKMRATSRRLLKQNGTTYSGQRPGSVERINGEEVATPAQELIIKGVQTEYKPSEIDGKTILSGDRQIIATDETAIKVGDIFYIDAQNWRVENPWPVKPAAILLCYKIQLRGV